MGGALPDQILALLGNCRKDRVDIMLLHVFIVIVVARLSLIKPCSGSMRNCSTGIVTSSRRVLYIPEYSVKNL